MLYIIGNEYRRSLRLLRRRFRPDKGEVEVEGGQLKVARRLCQKATCPCLSCMKPPPPTPKETP